MAFIQKEKTFILYIRESVTYSMHLVLFTGGWQGGRGLRKMGSFTTIRAFLRLSSELKHGKKKEKEAIKHRNLIRLQEF